MVSFEQTIERLEAGEDFAAVAAEVSLDQQSQGGVLGSAGDCVVHHSQMGEEFVAGVIDAPLGEVTGPVQTSFGYHVIQLEDSRSVAAPPFDEVKPEIAQQLGQQNLKKQLDDLKAKAKIEMVEAPAAAK